MPDLHDLTGEPDWRALLATTHAATVAEMEGLGIDAEEIAQERESFERMRAALEGFLETVKTLPKDRRDARYREIYGELRSIRGQVAHIERARRRHVRMGRAARQSTNHRRSGSRRAGASSSTSSSDPGDDSDEPEPGPRSGPLLLVADPTWGRANPAMLRKLRGLAR